MNFRVAFALIALTVGSALAFLTAPFQSPDEPAHFLRAYQVSEGKWVATFRGRWGGGELPASLVKVTEPFQRMTFFRQRITSKATIVSTLAVPLRPDVVRYESFPNTALLTPVSYAPQAAAMALGRRAGLSPLALLYAGRVGNLLAFTLLGYLAIGLAPVNVRALTLLLVMPMTLFQAGSVSADTMTNGLAALWTAMVLHHAIGSERPLRKRDLIGLVIVASSLALAKVAYVPLCLLVVLIPADRFGTRARRWAFLGVLLATTIGGLAAWSRMTPGLDAAIVTRPEVVPREQLKVVLGHPLSFAVSLWATLLRDFRFFCLSFVGWLGWLETRLIPSVIYTYIGVLIVACWPHRGERDLRPSLKWPAVLLLAVASTVVLVAVTQYLVWTNVGAPFVEGPQGRYFIPIWPAALLLVRSLGSLIPSRFALPVRSLWWDAAVILFACLVDAYTVWVVYHRYYVCIMPTLEGCR
jgi:uncharacterized membrane protein